MVKRIYFKEQQFKTEQQDMTVKNNRRRQKAA
jgi:hypothetical protein